jgi:hypothetical protein
MRHPEPIGTSADERSPAASLKSMIRWSVPAGDTIRHQPRDAKKSRIGSEVRYIRPGSGEFDGSG